MAQQDHPTGDPADPGGVHVEQITGGLGGGTHQPEDAAAHDDAEHQRHDEQVVVRHHRHGQHDDERRNREQHVDDEIRDLVGLSTDVPDEQADGNTDQVGDDQRYESSQQQVAAAVQNPGQQVPTELVGAQQVGAAGALGLVVEVLGERVVGREHAREGAADDDENEPAERDHDARTADSVAQGRRERAAGSRSGRTGGDADARGSAGLDGGGRHRRRARGSRPAVTMSTTRFTSTTTMLKYTTPPSTTEKSCV